MVICIDDIDTVLCTEPAVTNHAFSEVICTDGRVVVVAGRGIVRADDPVTFCTLRCHFWAIYFITPYARV